MTEDQVRVVLAGARRVRITAETDVAWSFVDLVPATTGACAYLRINVYLPDDTLTIERLPNLEPTEPNTVVMDRRRVVAVRDDDQPGSRAWLVISAPSDLDLLIDTYVAWSDLDDPRPVIRDER
jgi:hypothetical protein